MIGAVTADRVRELIEIRGTPKFKEEVIRSLIESGRVEEAAACLVHDTGRKIVLNLLQEPDFSKRLSALVVMEKALDENPEPIRKMVPLIAPLLSHADSRIRGDIADLLGKIGDPEVILQLEPLTKDPNPDAYSVIGQQCPADYGYSARSKSCHRPCAGNRQRPCLEAGGRRDLTRPKARPRRPCPCSSLSGRYRAAS